MRMRNIFLGFGFFLGGGFDFLSDSNGRNGYLTALCTWRELETVLTRFVLYPLRFRFPSRQRDVMSHAPFPPHILVGNWTDQQHCDWVNTLCRKLQNKVSRASRWYAFVHWIVFFGHTSLIYSNSEKWNVFFLFSFSLLFHFQSNHCQNFIKKWNGCSKSLMFLPRDLNTKISSKFYFYPVLCSFLFCLFIYFGFSIFEFCRP